MSADAVDPPVATVNGVPIAAAELEAEIARRGPARVAGPEAVAALLDELVGTRAVAEVARAAGYERDPAVLTAFRRALAARYREDLLEPRLAALAVSDAQVTDYYTGHPDAFRTPERVRGAVIHVAVPTRASAEKRAELRERAERARGEALQLGPDSRTFAGVAVRYSDDQATRYRGGDTGWLEPGRGPGRWPQPVLDALASLREPGQVGPLVDGEGGFYLVKLVEREASSLRPLAEVQERIRRQLLSEERRRLESEFQAACRAQVTVQVDLARLAAVAADRGYAAAQPAGPPPVPGR